MILLESLKIPFFLYDLGPMQENLIKNNVIQEIIRLRKWEKTCGEFLDWIYCSCSCI